MPLTDPANALAERIAHRRPLKDRNVPLSWFETLHCEPLRKLARAYDLAEQLGDDTSEWVDSYSAAEVINDLLPELERRVSSASN